MKGLLIAAVLAGFGLPAVAQVTPAEIAKFLESKQDVEADFYAENAAIYQALEAAPESTRRARAVAVIAAQWKISADAAAKAIDALVIHELTKYLNNQETDRRVAQLFQEATAAADESPEVWALIVEFWSFHFRCDEPGLRAAYLRHSFAESHYLKLDQCAEWAPAFVALYPDNLAGRFRLLTYVEEFNRSTALAVARWLLDGLAARRGAPLDDMEIATVQKFWKLAGRSGNGSLLLADYARRRPAEIDAVLHRKTSARAEVPGRLLPGQFDSELLRRDAREQLLWALAAAHRFDELRMEFDPAKDPGALADVIAGTTSEDIFDRYIGDGQHGLLWQAELSGTTAIHLIANFLDANQMETSAKLLRMNLCQGDYLVGLDDFRRQMRALPAAYQAHFTQLTHRSTAGDAAAGCAANAAVAPEEMSSNLPRYPETALTAVEKAAKPLANYTARLPVAKGFDLVRAEQSGAEIAALLKSPLADPGGEVGRGGYWLMQSHDGGATWLGPWYLGFQYQNPYVVSETARVSMFAGDKLRLEVSIEELDPKSIVYPVRSVGTRREARDLHIDIPLATITRDTDGDGFTDLLEAKLQTDPAKADTDGDGLIDSVDDFPQASTRGTPSPLAAILVDVLKQLTGFENAGIVEPIRAKGNSVLGGLAGRSLAPVGSRTFQFIVGDPQMYAGLRATDQVIVLNQAQVDHIRANYGPFFPLWSPLILIDPSKTRAHVLWGLGMTRGNFRYRLENGHWLGQKNIEGMVRQPPATSKPNISPG